MTDKQTPSPSPSPLIPPHGTHPDVLEVVLIGHLQVAVSSERSGLAFKQLQTGVGGDHWGQRVHGLDHHHQDEGVRGRAVRVHHLTTTQTPL